MAAAKAKPRAKKKSTATRPAQWITPYLFYADVDAALDWLSKAFGFKPMMKFAGPGGKTNHSAMKLANGEVFMLGCPGPKYKNPKRLGNVTQGLYITVEDVDKHYLRAKKAGAKIIDEPADQFYGDRRYSAADPEGHHWYFAQHVRDVSVKEMKGEMKKR
jgi:PhnB protein